MQMQVVEEIRKAHKLVWAFRGMWGRWWPTPDAKDALAFAVTEWGESVDALLRQSGDYNRNNPGGSTPEQEAADTALMVLTALGRAWNNVPTPGQPMTVERVMIRLCQAWGDTQRGAEQRDASADLEAVLAELWRRWPELRKTLEKRLEKIARRLEPIAERLWEKGGAK